MVEVVRDILISVRSKRKKSTENDVTLAIREIYGVQNIVKYHQVNKFVQKNLTKVRNKFSTLQNTVYKEKLQSTE